MLSGESAIGSYGQKALSVLQTASARMESWSRQENTPSFVNKYELKLSLLDKIADQICNCAAEMGKSQVSKCSYLLLGKSQVSKTNVKKQSW